MGLAGAGQSKGQDVDAALDEASASQLAQLLPQSLSGTRSCSKVSQVLPAGSLDAVRSRPMRRCLRSSASCSRTSRKVDRASPCPAAVKRATDCAPMVGSRN